MAPRANGPDYPMAYKTYRFGPQLLQAARAGQLDGQQHVLFGGTGAVGGATALQLIDALEEARAHVAKASPSQAEPAQLVLTAKSRSEIRGFTRLLFQLQRRDWGAHPQPLEGDKAGRGYLTHGGVEVLFESFAIDPSIPELANYAVRDDAARQAGLDEFLAAGGLTPGSPEGDKAEWLRKAVRERVGRPFGAFLEELAGREQRKARSVVIGIPMASVATYKLSDLELAAPHLGIANPSPELEQLKDDYLTSLADDLGHVAAQLSDEVLIAHTTAVGGMYDAAPDGARPIRLGFAHSAKGDLLQGKQDRADKLTELYAERSIKMLITAAAIGIDAVQREERVPLNGRIRALFQRELAAGSEVIDSESTGALRRFDAARAVWGASPGGALEFGAGTILVPEFSIRSGENGYFSVSNADALYRVMRVTSTTELGHVLARVALLGDDPRSPRFKDGVCYYTETDNSRQVFDLLSGPAVLSDQLSGLGPKALQDLGSAKHQGELHTLGLLILLHRLRTLDHESLPRHRTLSPEEAAQFFEYHSRTLTLERAAGWEEGHLADDLATLVGARGPEDLMGLLASQPSEQDLDNLNVVLVRVREAVHNVCSLGTPILFESEGATQVLHGPFIAPLDSLATREGAIEALLCAEFEAAGGGAAAHLDRWREFHIAGLGFCDLRRGATLVSARSPLEDLSQHVQRVESADQLRARLADLEPYSYFATSGLTALLMRLRGMARLDREFDPALGSANEFRAHLSRDAGGRALLVPGEVEALRMVWEGLEKNTATERLDGRWGYPPV